VTEMDPREDGINNLLRRSLAAAVPSLPPEFDHRVMRELRRNLQPLNRFRRALLIGYGLISAAASAVVMRGQGLDWAPITALIFAPLALVAAVPLVRRTTQTALRHSSK
jgi:hypothetical protein